jgi:hypothetical protein
MVKRGFIQYGSGAPFQTDFQWTYYNDTTPPTYTVNETYRATTVNINSVVDGTSNTYIVGERPPNSDNFWGWWDFSTIEDAYSVAWRSSSSSGDGHFYFSGTGPTGSYTCPNPWTYRAGGRFQDNCYFNAFWSFHPGGALFVYGDGSVRFLAYGIQGRPSSVTGVSVFEAMATRAGGEVVSND